MKLEGKVAAVTGGGSGMGRAISQALRPRRRQSRRRRSQPGRRAGASPSKSRRQGGEAIAVQTDVRDQAQAQAMVDAAVETFGGLDILVNNAGVGKIIPFLETTNEDWDFMFDVNCKGLLWCSQAAARQMIEQGRGGKIINLASQAGRRGEALVLAYCASKACVISMTQSMALALAPHKINVNGIAPGIVDTPFWVEVDKQFAEALRLGDRRAEAEVCRIDSARPHRAAGGRHRRRDLPRLRRVRLHDAANPQRRRRQLAGVDPSG